MKASKTSRISPFLRMNILSPPKGKHSRERKAGLVYGERCGYHIHYFPSQEALDLLCAQFATMRERSLELDRDPLVCQCEFRRDRKEALKEDTNEAVQKNRE